MTAKLSGSLLIYKDLPSATLARPAPQSDDTAPMPEAGDAVDWTGAASRRRSVAISAERGDERSSLSRRLLRAGCFGCGIAAATAAALFFFSRTGGETSAAVTSAPLAAIAGEAGPRSLQAAEREAGAQPAAADPATVAAAAPREAAAPSEAQSGSGSATQIAWPQPIPVPPAQVEPAPVIVADVTRPTPSALARLPADELAALLGRGDQLLGSGDIASARLFYERAAEGGDAQAALRLGESYDAAFLAQAGLTGVRGDAAAAARWYRHARALGAVEADILLAGIAAAGGAAAGDR